MIKLGVQIFLLLIALWSAHVAGAAYLLAEKDPKLRSRAVVRTGFSFFAAMMVLIV